MLDRTCVHCFTQQGIDFAVDGNSGSVHLLDSVAMQILQLVLAGAELDCAEIQPSLPSVDSQVLEETLGEITSLVNEGLLFSPDIGEIPPRTDTVVKALCLNVSHDCNLRCKYCFAETGEFGGKRELMSVAVGQAAVDFLIQHAGNRRQIEIDFFGGEPLLNFDVVQQTVAYGKAQAAAYDKEIRFTLTTNGVALTPSIQDFLNEHMYNVVLSLDGRPEINDAARWTINGKGSVYAMIVPTFQRFVAARGDKSYFVRGTFTRDNLDFSRDVIHLRDLGFDQISVEPVVAASEDSYALTEQELPQILREYETLAEDFLASAREGKAFNFFHFNVELQKGPCLYKRISGCGAGDEYLAVAPDGTLYPCHQFVGQADYVMGTVFTTVENATLQRTFQESHVLNKPTCQKCWAKYYCSGGCHSNNLKFSKDMKVPQRLACAMEKKRLECSFYIQSKKAPE